MPFRVAVLFLARLDEAVSLPAPEQEPASPEEHVLATVTTGPLIASILLENWWIVVILVGLLAGFAVSPHRVAGTVSRREMTTQIITSADRVQAASRTW